MTTDVATRHVTWGEGIVVELFKTHGGLKAVVDAIVHEMGEMIGTRNTFAKLQRVDDPATLGARDQWRAWLLLTALRQDPADWGIPASIVPNAVDAEHVARRLHALVRPKGFEPLTSCSAQPSASTSTIVKFRRRTVSIPQPAAA